MTSTPLGTPEPAAPTGGAAAHDRWEGLRTLVRARLLVAFLALPVGVLMRPEAEGNARQVLWWAMLAVGVLSAGSWVAVRLRRGLETQIYAQLAGDLVLVTSLSALTGG